jgi:dipeptidyl aminopeptidase/acylaminoacyl peptidase
MKRIGLLFICFFCLINAIHAEENVLKTSPLAVAFGSQPDFRSLHMSPDGDKLVVVQYHPDGYDFARTLDMKTMKSVMVYAATDQFDIDWCRWANDKRLLCGLSAMTSYNETYFQVTRLIGVDWDGKNLVLLKPKQFKKKSVSIGSNIQNTSDFSQNQTTIVDMKPDDPDNIQIMVSSEGESCVADMDISTAKLSNLSRRQEYTYRWITDGHGNPRLRNSYGGWFITDAKGWKWDILYKTKEDDYNDSFEPYGFGENPDELLYFDNNNGRRALFAMDLAHDRKTRLVYANDNVDVLGLETIGKYDRIVAVYYIEDKLQRYFFDKDIKNIYEMLNATLPGKNIDIVDEDWNRRYYVVYISSDTEPGGYYRFDSKERKLSMIGHISSKLKNYMLAPMQAIHYPARDNTPIPAFLTMPTDGKKTGLPAVILPHGGPSSRDIWDFDLLAQFFAANGYAVLQSNYRGSDGYGKAWLGDGAFHGWKTAIGDITDGTRYLIDQGIADPNKICVVGWSYGGYAALMSGIENPLLYKCIVSIAGVCDPRTLGYNMLRFVGGYAAQNFIGREDEVVKDGSPLERVDEIKIPVFLAHAEEDANVPFNQSKKMYNALKKKNKSVEFVHYEKAAHDISPPRYRIDLFTRVAEFLNENVEK